MAELSRDHNRRVMRSFVRTIQAAVVDYAAEVAREIFARATAKIPVVTGRARASGRVGLNRKPTFVPPADALTYPVMDDVEIDRTAARARIGDHFWLAWTVKYSGGLERGRSKQAPQGYLGPAIREAKASMARRRLTLRRVA